MRLPAALREWAVEHSDSLSDETIAEVEAIADAVAESDLATWSAADASGGQLNRALIEIFPAAQAKRARTLVRVVREWAMKQPAIDAQESDETTTTKEAKKATGTGAAEEDSPPKQKAAPKTKSEPKKKKKKTSGEKSAKPEKLTKAKKSASEPEPQLEQASEPEPQLEQVAEPEPELPAVELGNAAAPLRSQPAQPAALAPLITGPAPQPTQPTPPSAPSLGRIEPLVDEPIAAPAFLRSDKVDEEDDVRLYGPKRPWKAVVGSLIGLAVLAGIGLGAWLFFDSRNNADTDVATPTATSEATESAVPADETNSGDPGASTVDGVDDPATGADDGTDGRVDPADSADLDAEPEAPIARYWADTVPILNSGTSVISASTYAVSPANRAVLTGHTAAITGIAVADDGRVLTSGADRRLVDWGSDVTVASPDVLNVTSPLTVLTRTADQRIIAGDSEGTATIINLIDETEPVVLPVHDVAISAIDELADGRLAIASVDGDVAVIAPDAPDERLTLPHGIEVTAVVGLPDGSLATAAVDGVVRLWSGDDANEIPGEIATLNAPVTALTLLSDGQLATAAVSGAIHIVPAVAGAQQPLVFPGHIGPVRAVLETEMDDGTRVIASGGDDTTIRIWDAVAGDLLMVLEGHGDIISALAMLPDGRLVSTSGDGTGRVWDLSIPAGTPVIPPHDWNLSSLHPWENDQFITGGIDGKVVLASTTAPTEPVLVSQHDAPIVGISSLQNGDIVSLDAASVLRVNQPSGDVAGLIEFNIAAGATALDVREAEGVVTGHADGTVRFYDFESEVASIAAHGDGVNDVLALSNGMVVSAGQDMLVRVIDLENPDTVTVFDLHTSPVDALVELPDGRVASAGTDGIFIWSVDTLTQDAIRLNGQRSRTISLVGLPNEQLISTGADGRIRLWDLTTPESEPRTLVDIPGVINPYLIQADNGLFVAGAARGYVVFTLS